MNIQFSYKQVDEKGRVFLEDYLDKKISRLTTLLSEEILSSSRLEIRLEKFVKKEAYKVEIFLITPHKKFGAKEDDHTVIEAFDLALDKLIIQIRKDHERILKINQANETGV